MDFRNAAIVIFRLSRVAVCLAIGATLPFSPSTARTTSVALATQTFVERVQTDTNGRARRVLASAQNVARGDRLVVILRYRNTGTAPVSGFAIANPVPSAIRIDADDPAMQVSVDHGRNWGGLHDLQVPTALGGVRRATPDDITHVRWSVPMAIRPGDERRISYRAIVR